MAETYPEYQERLLKRYSAVSGRKMELYDPVKELLQMTYLCADDIARRAESLQKDESKAVEDAKRLWLAVGFAGGFGAAAGGMALCKFFF